MIYTPHVYQQHAEEHILSHKESGLFMEMGLGKTVVALTAANRLMFEEFEVNKVLVIAPLRVAEDTWVTEKDKWDHLKHLRISQILGPEKDRKAALLKKADVYIINRENVVWLISHLAGAWPFDYVIVDESSSFKSAKAARFKALRQVRSKIKRITILTGTPAPNGLLDLWPQLYLLDQGERLGKTITGYRTKYFKPGRRNGPIIYNYNLEKEKDEDLFGADYYEREIYDRISDICISMKTRDWLELPERIDHTVDVRLSAEMKAQYLEFERKQVLAFGDTEITAFNAAGLTGKLLQFANGAVYTGEGTGNTKEYYEVHNEKIKVLEEQLEAAQGSPMIVFYSYQSDVERIMKHLKTFKPHKLGGTGDIADWNRGKIPFLLAHSQSAGHGLNLQFGGHLMTWFGLPWSLENYSQAVARLDRQGQTKSVMNYRLVTKGTMDEDVVMALGSKANKQEALMQAVKARIERYKTLR